MKNKNKRIYTNHQIRAEKVRVIDENGQQIGIMNLEEAVNLAKKKGLDLIQITEKAEPPVCKLDDLGKFLYRLNKKQKTIKQGGELKNLRISFNISDHDLETRIKQAEKLLKKKNKIRIEMRLKGREKALQDFAKEKIKKFLEKINQKIEIKIERELKKEPRGLTVIISKK